MFLDETDGSFKAKLPNGSLIPISTTEEYIQDAFGNLLQDSSTVNFTYDDVNNTATLEVIQSALDVFQIPVIPQGNLTSANVGDAIYELQYSIDASDSSLADHLADPINAHAASAVGVTPSGNLAATDVQTALEELQADVDTRATQADLAQEIADRIAGDLAVQADLSAHVTDTVGAHAASAISNIPSGNLAATDVQGALNELQSSVDATDANVAQEIIDRTAADASLQAQLDAHINDATAAHAASAISVVPTGNLISTDAQSAFEAAQTALDAQRQLHVDTGEPTGFLAIADSTISFDNGTRTFTIAPTGASYDIYVKGQKITISTPQSIVIPDVSSNYFVALNSSGTLHYFTTFSEALIRDYAYVTNFYWSSSAADILGLAEERHGLTMDWATHAYTHFTVGARIRPGGFTAGNFTLSGGGLNSAEASISVANGVLVDEDLNLTITHSASPSAAFQQVLSPVAQIPLMYKLGSGEWNRDVATNYVVKTGLLAQWNKLDSGTWSIEDAPEGGYVAVWIFATNLRNEPIRGIVGQYVSTVLDDARNFNTYENLNLSGIPIQEYKALYRLMFRTSAAYTNTPKVELVEVLDQRRSIDQGTPVTMVNDHGNLTGLADDDHQQYLLTDGSRVLEGNLNLGGFNVTNVNLVDGRNLAVDGAKLDGIEAGATADQIASEVPFTPSGDLVATDVQTAIEELDTEKVPQTRQITAGTGLSGGGNLSSDVTLSLPNVGTPGSYGTSTAVPAVTTDAQGRITAVTETPINGVPAANIVVTPAGNLSATDVQAALQELQTDIDATSGAAAETAQDAVAAAFAAGTQDGVSVVYDDVANSLSLTNTDKGTVAVSAHEAALDPHPQYQTAAESQAQVDAHANLTNNPHGVTKLQVGLGNVQNIDTTIAANVTVAPTGNIAAVNVQDAIVELDVEKVPNTRQVTAGAGLTGGGDLTADRTISMPNVGTAATYGSASQVPVITTDAQGRVSNVTNTAISGVPAASITNTPSGNIAATDVQSAINELDAEKQPLDGDLTAVANLAGTGLIVRTAADTMTTRAVTGVSGQIAVTNSDGVSGDISVGLPSVGTPGSYGAANQVATITTDAQGRVSAATSVAISGVPAANITNVPAGDIVATTVQAAIDELDSDKARLVGGNVFTGGNQDITGSLILRNASSVFATFHDVNAGGSSFWSNNVDAADVVQDSSREQWRMVLSKNSDAFLIQRSPSGGTWTPTTFLSINSSGDASVFAGVRPGASSDTTPGNIQFTSGELLGYESSAWRNLAVVPTIITAGTGSITTTSGTFSTISGLSTTPAAGTYLVFYSVSASITSNSSGDVALFVDSVEQVTTTRRIGVQSYGFSSSDTQTALCAFAELTLNGSQAVSVRFRENGGGTMGVTAKSLMLIPIAR